MRLGAVLDLIVCLCCLGSYAVYWIQVTPGEVQSIYSDGEFEHVLKKHADQLVVVCASSSDCVPCRAFEPLFEVSHTLVSVHESLPNSALCCANILQLSTLVQP